MFLKVIVIKKTLAFHTEITVLFFAWVTYKELHAEITIVFFAWVSLKEDVFLGS